MVLLDLGVFVKCSRRALKKSCFFCRLQAAFLKNNSNGHMLAKMAICGNYMS